MKLPVIVLAGERPGGNPLAQQLGLPAGILAEVAGVPCVSRVLTALRSSETIDSGVIVGPRSDVAELEQMQEILSGADLRWLPPAAGPAESALLALDAVQQRPVLITSADHALLTPAIVDSFCHLALATDADFVVGLVPHARVRASFPESKRTLLKFADGTYCGSNLFMVKTAPGAGVVRFWQRMQSHRKRPWRMARELGISTLLRYVGGRLLIRAALDRIGALSGCRIDFVELLEARAAVDVDSVADHALAEQILSADAASERTSSC